MKSLSFQYVIGAAAIFVFSACSMMDSESGATTPDAQQASANTQKAFDDYWAQQRQMKETGEAPEKEDKESEEKDEPKKESKPKKVTQPDVEGIDLSGKFPTAAKVQGREGYVISPYNDKVVDVKGVESGLLVADPRFDLSERKFFIVP